MEGICIVEGCENPRYARGFCRADHQRWHHGRLDVEPLPSQKAGGRICKVEGCPNRHDAKGLCSAHYAHAQGRREIPSRERARTIHLGYALIWKPGHPNAQKSGYVIEHIYVMSEMLGRPVAPDETVHHRNGVRSDNRPENLELWVSRHCKGTRVEDIVAWAREILDQYGELYD